MSMNADHSYSPRSPQPYGSPPLSVVLVVILIVCFFIGFFSVYLCKCILESVTQSWRLQRSPQANLAQPPSDQPVNPGLDAKIIQSFPLFPYALVKDHRTEKYASECAICLSDYDDGDMLRLLTTCYHVFHHGCIDRWLESHKTCPVCRNEPNPDQNSPEKSPANGVIFTTSSVNENGVPAQDSVSITVRDNVDNEEVQMAHDRETVSGRAVLEGSEQILSRSHSTGHSILTVTPEEENIYTLRLPEHARAKITRGHKQTESCITFGELTSSARVGNISTFREVSACSS